MTHFEKCILKQVKLHSSQGRYSQPDIAMTSPRMLMMFSQHYSDEKLMNCSDKNNVCAIVFPEKNETGGVFLYNETYHGLVNMHSDITLNNEIVYLYLYRSLLPDWLVTCINRSPCMHIPLLKIITKIVCSMLSVCQKEVACLYKAPKSVFRNIWPVCTKQEIQMSSTSLQVAPNFLFLFIHVAISGCGIKYGWLLGTVTSNFIIGCLVLCNHLRSKSTPQVV